MSNLSSCEKDSKLLLQILRLESVDFLYISGDGSNAVTFKYLLDSANLIEVS